MTDDSDAVTHLLDLLDLLPALEVDDVFWERFAEMQARHDPRGLDEIAADQTEALFSRVADVRANPASDAAVVSLALQCLTLFDGREPALWDRLDALVDYPSAWRTTGRRWAEDICATAWRLYVPRRARTLRNAGHSGTVRWVNKPLNAAEHAET
jgi:hypothetical protein